VTKSH